MFSSFSLAVVVLQGMSIQSSPNPLTVAQSCPPPLSSTNRNPGSSSATSLLSAIESLRGHITGTSLLADDAAIVYVANSFTENAPQLTSSLQVLEAALDLIDDYESSQYGPMFVNEARFPKGEFSRVVMNGDGFELDRAVMLVQQAILDEVYHASLWGPHDQGSDPVDWEYDPIVKECADVLRGRKWEMSRWLAGTPVGQPAMVPLSAEEESEVRVVTVNASFPEVWGRPVTFSHPDLGLSRRIRPLGGWYLIPGEIGSVNVPLEIVNAGYTIQVGSHAVNANRKSIYGRIDRMTSSFPISEETTYIASPLGGELFLRSPYGSIVGVIDIQISGGVVPSASFFLTSQKTTTEAEWDELRTTAPAPWVSLETDNFLLQVPRIWLYGFDYQHMHLLLTNYTNVMNAVSEIVGIPPEKRNNYIHYEGLSQVSRAAAAGVGYPQCNMPVFGTPYGPDTTMWSTGEGKEKHWLVNDTMMGNTKYGAVHVATSFHELGHSQKYAYSCYPGEKESIVHVPYTYARNVVYNESLDESFKLSLHYQNPITHIPNLSVDGAAIDWMVRDNFRLKNPMDTLSETRYQHIGHGKYADIARLFGWQVIKDFYRQEHLDHIAQGGFVDYHPDMDNSDSRTLRLSIKAGQDLTPLIHFWGIHPVDEVLLKQRMLENNLLPSWTVKKQLLHYANIVPKTRQEFYDHWQKVWKPVEVKKCQSQCSWYQAMEPLWGEEMAAQAVDTVLYIIAKYWPANTCVESAPSTTGVGRRMGGNGVGNVRGNQKDNNQTNGQTDEKELKKQQQKAEKSRLLEQELTTAKIKWLSHHLLDYNFEMEHEIFGASEEETGPFAVEVRNGHVTNANYKNNGHTVDLDFVDDILSVKELFHFIGVNLYDNIYDVKYDSELGYPKEIFFIGAGVNDDPDDDEESDELYFKLYLSNVTT